MTRQVLGWGGVVLVACLATGCATVDSMTRGGIRPVGSAAEFDRSAGRTDVPTVAFFYSPSCPHCRSMMRKLPGIASDYRGRVQFVAADVTRLGGLRQRYGIKGVPVILFLRGGGVEDKVVGNLPWASMSIRRRIGALLTTEP